MNTLLIQVKGTYSTTEAREVEMSVRKLDGDRDVQLLVGASFGWFHYQHRACRMVGTVVAHASYERPLDLAKPKAPDNQQISMQLLRSLTNHLLRTPLQN